MTITKTLTTISIIELNFLRGVYNDWGLSLLQVNLFLPRRIFHNLPLAFTTYWFIVAYL